MQRDAPMYTDEQLCALISANNKLALDYLYHKYGGALSYVIGKTIHDNSTVEYILQDTLVIVWHNIGAYNSGESRLYIWMRNIADNKAKDFAQRSANNKGI